MTEQKHGRLPGQHPDRHQLDRAHWGMTWTRLAVFGALSLFSSSELARTQQADRPYPAIMVAPTITVRPGSKVLLAIKVGPPEALPKKSFVSLRGLPPSVSLPGWENIGSGSWAIPLFALPTLMADIPLDLSGRSQVTVSLMAIDGSLLAEAQTTLIVDSQLPKEPLVHKPATNPLTKPVLPTLSIEERARAEHLVAQGEKYLDDANIEVARQFFRRAADAGLAAAALRLAATYDPAELAHLQAEGVVANPAEARKWYERARDLGATEAEGRLARFGPETR